MEFQHKSVLLQECIDALNIRPDGIYLNRMESMLMEQLAAPGIPVRSPAA